MTAIDWVILLMAQLISVHQQLIEVSWIYKGIGQSRQQVVIEVAWEVNSFNTLRYI